MFAGLELEIVLIIVIVVNCQSWLDPVVIVAALPTAWRYRLDVVHHRDTGP